MFRRPGIQTQTFKYVESSFGMRNSNLGERNVIVVSVTSTGEDPNTYPIVPKGKNFQTKKALHEPVTMSLCTTHFIYIYYIIPKFFTSTQKNMEKKSRTSGRNCYKYTPLIPTKTIQNHRFEKNDAIQSFEGFS